MKDYTPWSFIKPSIDDSSIENFFFREREIWWCSIGMNIGHEEDGKNHLFERPVLVIKKFNKHIFLAIPLSSQEKENKYYIPFVHENGSGQAMISQVRLLSSKRLSRKISTISFEEHKKIIDAFKNIL